MNKIASLPGEDDPLQDSKCSMTMALTLALYDPQLKWSDDKQKILIAFPLRPSHLAGTSGGTSTTEVSRRTKPKTIHEMGPRWRVYFNGEKEGHLIPLSCDDQRPPSAEDLKQVVTENKAFVIIATFLPESMEEIVGHSYSAGETSPFRLFSNELMCASWFSQNNSITGKKIK